MNALRFLLGLVFLVNWLAGGLSLADEANENVDSVLSRWEEASQNCQTLDAKLIIHQCVLVNECKGIHGQILESKLRPE